MYNNIENFDNIVNQLFQNLYDTSTNVISDISSANPAARSNISILMENIFNTDNTYETDISFLSYNYLSSNYLSNNYLPNNYLPNNYLANSYLTNNFLDNRSYYRRRYSFMDFMNTLSQNNTSTDNSFMENFINSTFENNTEKFKKVIANHELEKLIPQKFIKEGETETNCQCPILCYNFEENEEIIKLPCNHNFNCEAIKKWLTMGSNTCPVCRYEFDYKEINIDNKRQETQAHTQAQADADADAEAEAEAEADTDAQADAQAEADTDAEAEATINEILYSNFIDNNISEDEILLQELLLHTYSNSINSPN